MSMNPPKNNSTTISGPIVDRLRALPLHDVRSKIHDSSAPVSTTADANSHMMTPTLLWQFIQSRARLGQFVDPLLSPMAVIDQTLHMCFGSCECGLNSSTVH